MAAEIVDRVRAAFDRCKDAPELTPEGRIALIELRNLVPDLLAHVAALERDREEWVEIERLRLGRINPSSAK